MYHKLWNCSEVSQGTTRGSSWVIVSRFFPFPEKRLRNHSIRSVLLSISGLSPEQKRVLRKALLILILIPSLQRNTAVGVTWFCRDHGSLTWFVGASPCLAIHFPDGTRTQVLYEPEKKLKEVMERLCRARSLKFKSFVVQDMHSNTIPVDIKTTLAQLRTKEMKLVSKTSLPKNATVTGKPPWIPLGNSNFNK